MIQIIDKKDCNGCSACYTACPKHCISMQKDNEGFLYPYVDISVCDNCSICERVCPEINPVREIKKEQRAYLVQHKNNTVRKESTSGGAFTAIAEYVIKQNGVVFGVTYDTNFIVHHTYVETIPDLKKFRNSKYVQSEIRNSFFEVKEFLKENRLVCFSGTPCQIEGLKSFLRKEYQNLITVDVVCHAVPSPLVWNKYQILHKIQPSKVNNILFRDKASYGYKYSVMSIYNNQMSLLYKNGVETDVMLRSFFSNICDRPSCYNCSFKKRYRISDFTLWDCFDVYKFSKKFDDDKGTTRVLTHSEKANTIISEVSPNIFLQEINVEKAVFGVREMFESVPINEKREMFFSDIHTLPVEIFFSKYFPNSYKSKIEKFIRIISYKMGIYSIAKRAFKLIYKNRNNQKS